MKKPVTSQSIIKEIEAIEERLAWLERQPATIKIMEALHELESRQMLLENILCKSYLVNEITNIRQETR